MSVADRPDLTVSAKDLSINSFSIEFHGHRAEVNLNLLKTSPVSGVYKDLFKLSPLLGTVSFTTDADGLGDFVLDDVAIVGIVGVNTFDGTEGSIRFRLAGYYGAKE